MLDRLRRESYNSDLSTGIMKHTILHGCLFDQLPTLPDRSVHAVITSPPYAQQRQKQYGGVPETDYPAWTVRWMTEVRRVLVERGNVAIIIRPHVVQGVVSDYVLRTRLALREVGWYEIEELIWIKPTAPPLGNILRPRRSWESILWFSNSREPFCDPLANGAASGRLGLDSVKGMDDYLHDKQAREVYSGVARCRDYVEVATQEVHKESYNSHPAQFPAKLARWLVRLLSPPDGSVLDPFMGSGTTLLAARLEGRNATGIEINRTYVEISQRRLRENVPVADELFHVIPVDRD